jgi:hypothetical protein
MADGDAIEMVAAMVDGDRNRNGQWQWQQQWAIVTATATATAMAMATEWQWQRRLRRQWQWQWPQQGQPLQKGCLFMWQRCAALFEGRHLASTSMDTKESAFTSAASWG